MEKEEGHLKQIDSGARILVYLSCFHHSFHFEFQFQEEVGAQKDLEVLGPRHSVAYQLTVTEGVRQHQCGWDQISFVQG